MRYFYHLRWGFDTNKERPSTLIKEIRKEVYDSMVEREKDILLRNPNLKHFNEPFESEDIPEGKTLIEL